MNKLARVALIITLSVASSPPARSVAHTSPNVSVEDWLYDSAGYARAVELQRKLNVPLVVYFYTDRCPDCRTLDNHYLPTAPVQDYLRGVVKVRINPEHGVPERALAKRYRVSGYPSFLVISHSTAQPLSVQPFRRVNNMTPTQFADACRAITPVSRKPAAAAIRNSGTSGKFRERPEVITKTMSTAAGERKQ